MTDRTYDFIDIYTGRRPFSFDADGNATDVTNTEGLAVTIDPGIVRDENGIFSGITNTDGTIFSFAPATWYAGEVASVVTPVLTADGTATSQVPSYWRVVIDAHDDVTAAQALLDGGPNVRTIQLGESDLFRINNEDNDIQTVYAICVSTASSGEEDTNIIAGSGCVLADVLSDMSAIDFSGTSGIRLVSITATQVHDTNIAELMVNGGVQA